MCGWGWVDVGVCGGEVGRCGCVWGGGWVDVGG